MLGARIKVTVIESGHGQCRLRVEGLGNLDFRRLDRDGNPMGGSGVIENLDRIKTACKLKSMLQ